MNQFIFRTNVKTKKKAKLVAPIFDNLPIVTRWSLDTEDIDNVLKIEASESLHENVIIDLMKTYGFHCEILRD